MDPHWGSFENGVFCEQDQKGYEELHIVESTNLRDVAVQKRTRLVQQDAALGLLWSDALKSLALWTLGSEVNEKPIPAEDQRRIVINGRCSLNSVQDFRFFDWMNRLNLLKSLDLLKLNRICLQFTTEVIYNLQSTNSGELDLGR